jgi:hypothetical protein
MEPLYIAVDGKYSLFILVPSNAASLINSDETHENSTSLIKLEH